MGTLIILSLIFVAAPLAFMFVTREMRSRDRPIETPATNPELLRRPPRPRYPL